MSIVKRKKKLIESQKMTSQRSLKLRRDLIKFVDKNAEKERAEFNVKVARVGYNNSYFNVLRKYVQREANETSAAVSVAKRDRASLQQKYRLL